MPDILDDEVDDYETPVIFRKRKGEIVAVFPTMPGDMSGFEVAIYMHVGQHSSASWGWYNASRRAKPEEYADLLEELKSLGYRPKIYQKRTNQHRREYNKQIEDWRNRR